MGVIIPENLIDEVDQAEFEMHGKICLFCKHCLDYDRDSENETFWCEAFSDLFRVEKTSICNKFINV